MQSDSHLQRFLRNLLYLFKGQVTVPLKFRQIFTRTHAISSKKTIFFTLIEVRISYSTIPASTFGVSDVPVYYMTVSYYTLF